MNELDVKNATWLWLYRHGFNPYDRKVFWPIYEAILRKLKNADGDDEGGLAQILIKERTSLEKLVNTILEKTSNKEIQQFANDILIFDIFNMDLTQKLGQEKPADEEKLDLSDLEFPSDNVFQLYRLRFTS